jgi:membrane associated rhomboid family serine protease
VIIPLSHESLRGRRWPVITIGIIAINVIVFLFTIGPMQRQLAETNQIQIHILILNGMFPDIPVTPEANELVQEFKLDHPDLAKQLADPNRTDFVDSWDMHNHITEFTEADARPQMDELCAQLVESRSKSIAWNYAFHPVHAFAQTYITSQFLHGGWLHIIFNMWFLWLAGTILEDLWGRFIYPVFYLIAGAFACAVQGAIFPHSLVPALGASGAIAGLMGAFLARFPTTKIRLGMLIGFRPFRFSVPAYIILPLWLLSQIFWGFMVRSAALDSGVAYWAHIGGFAFGALGAYVLRATGIEHAADAAVDAKISWSADPLIVRASDALEANQPDQAIATLKQLIAQSPDSIEAWDLLLKAQTRKQDFAGQRETLGTLIRLHVVAGEIEIAAQEYIGFKNLGGAQLQRATWLELCRYFESQHSWQTAAEEYELLGQAHPTHRAGLSATISAAQIYLTQLQRIDRAEKLFKATQNSRVPHTEFDEQIEAGLAQCAAATPAPAQNSSYGH